MTKEDILKEEMQGRLTGQMDKSSFEAFIEHSSFSADNIGGDSSQRKRKRAKPEREETASDKAKKIAKTLRTRIGRLGPTHARCAAHALVTCSCSAECLWRAQRACHTKWCRLSATAIMLQNQTALPNGVRDAWPKSLCQVKDDLSSAEKALLDVANLEAPEEDKNYEAAMAEAEQALQTFDEVIMRVQKLIIKKKKQPSDGAGDKSKKRKRNKKAEA